MTVIRFEIIDPDGVVQVDNGLMSSPEYRTAQDDAQRIADDFGPGWRVRLWKDVNVLDDLASLGDPHANVHIAIEDQSAADDVEDITVQSTLAPNEPALAGWSAVDDDSDGT